MRTKTEEKIQIPEGVSCSYENKIINCKKDSKEASREIYIPETLVEIKDNFVILTCLKSNKSKRKIIISNIKHIGNMFEGLSEPFLYKLEACNVHFPMTLKLEGNTLIVNNFLGEKIPRHVKILPNVDVQIKGQVITVSSQSKDSAGQTASNIEKATFVKNRDRRIFQDGIYITEKPGSKQ